MNSLNFTGSVDSPSQRPAAIICSDPDVQRSLLKKLGTAGKILNLGLHQAWAGRLHQINTVIAFPPDDHALVYAAVRQLVHLYDPTGFLFFGDAYALTESPRAGDLGVISKAGRYPYPALFQNHPPPQPEIEINIASQIIIQATQVLKSIQSKHALQADYATWSAGLVDPRPWLDSQFNILRDQWQLDVCSNAAIGFFEALSDTATIITSPPSASGILMITEGRGAAVAEEYQHRKKQFVSAANEAVINMLINPVPPSAPPARQNLPDPVCHIPKIS